MTKPRYWFKCGRTKCDDEYMGESAKTFEERYKEHLRAPLPIFEHQNILATLQQCNTSKKNKHNRSKYGQGHKRIYIHQS